MAHAQLGLGLKFTSAKSSFKRGLQSFTITTKQPATDLYKYIACLKPFFEGVLLREITNHKGIKVWARFNVLYDKPFTETTTTIEGFISPKAFTFLNDFEMSQTISQLGEEIIRKNDHVIRLKSGLIFKEIQSCIVDVSRFQPTTRGRTYQLLPQFLARKEAILNVKNNDDRCFGYSVVSAMCAVGRKDHANRPSHYDDKFSQFGLDKISYPVNVEDIEEIEKKLQIGINVFGFYDDMGMARYPLFLSKGKYSKEVDLLYWNDHYAWIKNFSRFMSDLT